MSSYPKEVSFVVEYIRRTRELLKQYDGYIGENYEATLFCNCLLGLLVFPKEAFYRSIKDDLVSAENLQVLKQSMKGNTSFITRGKGDVSDLAFIIRHMRNAVSHYKVKLKSGSGKEKNIIKNIVFQDNNFLLEIGVEQLKSILMEFCDNIIK